MRAWARSTGVTHGTISQTPLAGGDATDTCVASESMGQDAHLWRPQPCRRGIVRRLLRPVAYGRLCSETEQIRRLVSNDCSFLLVASFPGLLWVRRWQAVGVLRRLDSGAHPFLVSMAEPYS
jgi:hypothetical protein